MREIRAWDKENKTMIHHGFAVKSTGETVLLGAGKNGPTWTWTENLISMDWTGLKDKNGVKIFEGDVLTHKYYSSPVLCEFKNGSFCMEDIGINDSSLEVIGNIHENPELLKEKLDGFN